MAYGAGQLFGLFGDFADSLTASDPSYIIKHRDGSFTYSMGEGPTSEAILNTILLGASAFPEAVAEREAGTLPFADPEATAVEPVGAPKSPSVARILAKIREYPKIIDLRTGRDIPFPSDIGGRVPVAARVPWNKRLRDAFIAEWQRRGYEVPRGGWENYDIHHIRPREFGGTNDFWNLVPVDRDGHKLFNGFWRQFTGL